MKTIKQFTLLILLSLVLQTAALACGAPQMVYGRASDTHGNGISRAVVHLAPVSGDELSQTVVTNSFGYYAFEPLHGCTVGYYRVYIWHRSAVFIEPTRTFFVDGGNSGHRIDFIAWAE